MKIKTHIAFSIFILIILYFYYPIILTENKILFSILFILFSIVPDIDLHSSYIGNKLKVASDLFEIVFGHRGLIHSLWIALILYFILIPFNLEFTTLGFLSHLMLDSLNTKGIYLFWPFLKIKYKIKINGIFENVLFFTFLTIDLFLVSFLLNDIF